jgi:NhaP-type Na+/H+ or K+/H+ antiporter
VPIGTYLPRLLSRKLRAARSQPALAAVALIGWTGMRGIVSLALALALPLTLPTASRSRSARWSSSCRSRSSW